MSSIQELYSLLLVPSNESVAQATAELTEIYKDPSNISALIECLQSETTNFIKTQAAIGIRQMILQHADAYIEAGNVEELKSQILTVLVGEADKRIRFQIVNICDAFFNGKEMAWPELLEFANSLFGAESTVEQQELALRIYGIIISNSQGGEVVDLLETVTSLILSCLSTEDTDLISGAADLTSVLCVTFEAPVPNEIMLCYNKLVEVFHAMLAADSDFAYKVANALEGIANQRSCIESNLIFQNMMEILEDESIPDGKVFHIFTPISTLIEERYSDIEDKVETIVAAMMNGAGRAFTEGCASEQEDIYIICQTIDKMICESDPDQVFSAIEPELTEETPGQTFADIYFLQLFIEQAADTAAKHIPLIAEFLLGHVDGDQEHSILELVFECLHIFIKVVNAGLSDYTQRLLEAGLSAAQADHEPLAISALNMLSEMFTTLPVDLTAPGEVLNTIISIAVNTEGDVQERALYCAHAVVFAAGESVAEFAEQLLGIFKQAVEVPVDDHPRMKATGLLGIAMLHKAVPQLMSSVLGETIALLAELLQCEDLSVVNSALTASLILAESSGEQIAEVIPVALQCSINLIDREWPSNGEGEEEDAGEEFFEESEEVRELTEAKLNALDFIRVCAEKNPESLAPIAEALPDKLISLVSSVQSEIVSSQAVKCLGIVTLKIGLDANEILAQLIDSFNHPSIDVVMELFSLAKTFIKRGVDIGQTQIAGVIENAQAAIARNLECQVDEEQDFELLEKVYRFLRCLAINVPDLFPRDEIIKAFRYAAKKEKYETLAFMSLIFGDFYAAHAENLENVEKAVICQCVFEGIKGCDGYLPPYPFLAASLILEADPERATQYVQIGIDAVNEIYHAEGEGQPYLQETYAAATTFILVLIKKSGGSIDVSELMEPLCASFPIKEKWAARIAYPALGVDFTNCTAIFEPGLSQLCIGLAKFFALTNNEFNEIKLDRETLVAVAGVLRTILSQAEGAQQLADEQIENEAAIARYKQRIASYV